MQTLVIPKTLTQGVSQNSNIWLSESKDCCNAVKCNTQFALPALCLSQVTGKQSFLVKSGHVIKKGEVSDNCTFKILFFSPEQLQSTIDRYLGFTQNHQTNSATYFSIKYDYYIQNFVRSLDSLPRLMAIHPHLLEIKFSEIMIYLLHNYGIALQQYVNSLINIKVKSEFQQIIETNAYANLSLEKMASLCNMSLSAFKRRFIAEYGINPGKWFQRKKLHKAKELLEKKHLTPSQVYIEVGYGNLSNFSFAFKKQFGISPKQVQQIK